ncbi:MAG: hypothetical protein ABSE89_05375 [Sedimentisphaerales bacterium]
MPKNELGAFSFIRFDSKANYRPVYGIAFEKLLLTNNSFGPFKTAMHKKAIISDLQLRFYNWTPAGAVKNSISETKPVGIKEQSKTAMPSVLLTSGISSPGSEELIRDTVNILTRPSNRYSVANFNITNVSEVYMDRFDCRFFSEDTLLLSIKCREAIASYKDSNVELRGHVTIKTKDGTTLEGNYVEWDIRNNIFNVQGLYALNQNGAIKTGRNACFDSTLNEVSFRQAKNYVKEEYKCIAGL